MADPQLPDHDDDLDEMIEETFPASDPPSHTGETGIRIGEPRVEHAEAITDHPERQQFELTIDGLTAFLAYERSADTLRIIHTEVPEPLRGRHLGESLVHAALAAARAEGRRVVAICPFARAYMRRHPPAA
jgi:predicted GNAT family acetyltransferase